MELTPTMFDTLRQVHEIFNAPWSHKFRVIEKHITIEKEVWLDNNCTGKWEYNSIARYLMFSNENDKVLYTMTWL